MRKESMKAALSPVVAMLAEKLGATEHDTWTALFAISHNPAFDAEMREYYKRSKEDNCKGKA